MLTMNARYLLYFLPVETSNALFSRMTPATPS